MQKGSSLYAALWLITGLASPGAIMNSSQAAAQKPAVRTVIVNRVPLPDHVLAALERQGGAVIPAGSYWYDAVSGAWGFEGGPTAGFTAPGLRLGGPLRADASHGDTRVFINGRELHRLDVLGLQRIAGMVLKGRYWVDAQGNGGYEGGPAVFNLRVLAAQAARNGTWQGPGAGVGENHGGGAWSYANSNTGIGVISDGQGGMAVFDH